MLFHFQSGHYTGVLSHSVCLSYISDYQMLPREGIFGPFLYNSVAIAKWLSPFSSVGDPIYGVCDGARKRDFVSLPGSPERWLGVGELRNSCDGEKEEGRRGGERDV